MKLREWEDLPHEMQMDEVRPYYDSLKSKQTSLILKRIFDVAVSSMMLIILSPVFLILAILIKIDSPGPVFFRQVRITQYGKPFRIFKFRTMVNNAEKMGTQVTVEGDNRITRVGSVIRKYRLDEISQLIDVFRGTMTFVGVRPEVVKYVDHYTPEMRATLLLPAGVTNLTCIYYREEAALLEKAENADSVYVEEILPKKMKLNMEGILRFSVGEDIKIMVVTFLTMFGKLFKVKKLNESYLFTKN